LNFHPRPPEFRRPFFFAQAVVYSWEFNVFNLQVDRTFSYIFLRKKSYQTTYDSIMVIVQEGI
jgi:hypothetical protein